MKIWTSEYTFNFPWEKTCHAAFNKYPNPFNPAVEAIDVVHRKVDEDGILHSRRLLSTSWGIPSWARKILGFSDAVYIDEKSQVDLKNRSFTLESINLTFGNTVECKEKMIYSPHPEDPEKTLLVQETAIEVKTMAMTSYLEGVALDNVVPNVQKGRRAIEWVMEEFHNFAKWEEWMHQAVSLTDDVKKLGIRGIRDVEAHVEKVKQNSILLESNPGES